VSDMQPEASPESSEAAAEIRIEHDYLLELFVRMANHNDELELPLTLCVGGLIVTGFLIGGRRYFDLLAEDLVGDAVEGATELRAELRDMTVAKYGSPGEDPEQEPVIGIIHLRDAHVIGSAGLIPSNRGVVWRGRLIEVDGWCIGTLSTPS
jgi:hypothetical protein